MGYQLDFGVLAEYFSLLLHGVEITLGLTAISATLGLAFSIGGAATARWGPKWARALVMSYVELIRNTPFIVQLFFVFFGLPSLGLQLTALQAAVLAMTINLTAYAIEIMRAGIEAVPPGLALACRHRLDPGPKDIDRVGSPIDRHRQNCGLQRG